MPPERGGRTICRRQQRHAAMDHHRHHRRRSAGIAAIHLLLAALPMAALAQHAGAQDIGNPASGFHLADRWCNSCHAIEPTPLRRIDTGAPPFAAIAQMPSTTPLALSAFLQTPHAQMPDLQLSHDEIDDLTAYILSLRRN